MHRTALILVACAVAVAGVPPSGFAKDPVERLTAFAVDMSTSPDARSNQVRSGTVNIAIERWSTEEERKRQEEQRKAKEEQKAQREKERAERPKGMGPPIEPLDPADAPVGPAPEIPPEQ